MQVHLDDLLHRHGALEQLRNAFGWHSRPGVDALDIDALEQRLHRNGIPHRGNVAGHRAIAQRHQQLAAAADDLDLFQVLLARNRPFDESDVDGFGELFRQLTYQELGTASIMSRATAGVINGKVVICFPGSLGAATLAVDKIILLEIGHLVREATR